MISARPAQSQPPVSDEPMQLPATSSVEIERKWAVAELPCLVTVPGEAIRQGYTSITKEGVEVRVRQRGQQYFQTIKGDGELIRSEVEFPLEREQFDVLWPRTEGRRVEKTRYAVPYDGATIEVDVYHGALQGLVVAEVEFSSLQDAEQFVPPAWFGREVTSDKRYKNKNLAVEGLPLEE